MRPLTELELCCELEHFSTAKTSLVERSVYIMESILVWVQFFIQSQDRSMKTSLVVGLGSNLCTVDSAKKLQVESDKSAKVLIKLLSRLLR